MPKRSRFNCADYTSILWIPRCLVEFRLKRALGAASAVLKGSSSPRWNNLSMKLWPRAPEVPFSSYANNTCLPGLISAPNHKGFLGGSFRWPWVTNNPTMSKLLRVHLRCSPTPFAVVSHKSVWNALKWQHLGVFFLSSICALLEL